MRKISVIALYTSSFYEQNSHSRLLHLCRIISLTSLLELAKFDAKVPSVFLSHQIQERL